MAKLSGLQRDVLSLYRNCLRAARKKPEASGAQRQRRNWIEEFEKNISIGKRDFGAIEYMLRKGHRQLEIYEDPGIRDIHR
ncbi:hypothetical protein IWX90DRAFT_377871 [Phyllosticta citrichinensis]|uniref:Complex 1 LYR protein domain-containing protein n=1 Tax=Phyllosticta citrichinensis TaxID=1130410 RepID=A0ABR1Y610_9PEZI